MTVVQPSTQATGQLKRTPLYDLHIELGARMVPFAGYEMPVQYANGILKEHLHVRTAAGLFDVSHMGQLAIRSRGADVANAAAALESVVPVDLLGLAAGRQRYALLTNENGGVRDDLMITRMDDRLLVVANAACKDADENYLREALAGTCGIDRREDRALLALQGPMAESVLTSVAPGVAGMRFMDVRAMSIFAADCIVSRSGYTGEDGFEISAPQTAAENFARKLLDNPHVAMIGLGARDSLRLEAGLCLYGSDLDTETTPVEAALEWSIQPSRRTGGARAGGFPGAGIILDQFKNGAPRRRIGLRPEGKAPIRHGAPLFADSQSHDPVGVVTSGGFGPSVNAPVAMGYVNSRCAIAGALIFAELRGERVPVRIAKFPFVPSQYKR
jgi:glycine cleavage system T protein (aminomethyltransferase)